MKLKQLVILTGIVAFTGAVSAGPENYFSKLDIDGDGVLSMEEASADPVLRESWSTADANQDGRLEQAEFSAFEMKAAEGAT